MTEVMQVREAYRVEQWRQLMQQRKDSPLNNREFCAQQGISEKSNYYWLKKLRESAGSCSQVLVSGVHDPVLSGATNRFLSENRKPIDRIS